MKKVLLATTALVLSAGVASAEVSLSGSGRMGMNYLESRSADKVQFEYRTRISLTGSTQTDSGLTFSGTIRLQDSTTTPTTQAIGVNVSGAFGSLTFGSESSAAEYAVGDIAGVGYTGLNDGDDTAFLTSALVLYSYTAGGFTGYASAGQNGTDDYSLGATYSANNLTVGLGFEDNGTQNATSGSVAYVMGETTLKAVYLDSDAAGKQMGASVAHTMGAVSLAAYYQNTDGVGAGADVKDYGLGASYDLGGGAALGGGVASINDVNSAELGVTFSF